LWSLFELTIVCISAAVIYIYSDANLEFINRMDVKGYEIFWIAIYGLLYLCFFIRRMMLVCLWCCFNDPRLKQSKINCLTFSILNSFEFVWFVYGNFIFYKKSESRSSSNLWRIMLGCIIYGYVSMFVYLISILGMLMVFCVMKS
jgi:hypothetical protein